MGNCLEVFSAPSAQICSFRTVLRVCDNAGITEMSFAYASAMPGGRPKGSGSRWDSCVPAATSRHSLCDAGHTALQPTIVNSTRVSPQATRNTRSSAP
jgi:hypothetical protein